MTGSLVDLKEKRARLHDLYARFAKAAEPHVVSAVCGPGCADCCTTVGSVDITTMEGMMILRHLQGLSPAVREAFNKKLKLNRKQKAEAEYARCAFLLENNLCGIYEERPFSCRRLYSLETCGEATGPTVHREVWSLSESTVSALQQLDDTGYSGHLSYILQLLQDPKFRKTYLDGDFAPDAIAATARKNGILINRFQEGRRRSA